MSKGNLTRFSIRFPRKHRRKKNTRPRVWFTFSHLIINLKHLKGIHQELILPRLLVSLSATGSERALHPAPPAGSQLCTKEYVGFPFHWVSLPCAVHTFTPLKGALFCKCREEVEEQRTSLVWSID